MVSLDDSESSHPMEHLRHLVEGPETPNESSVPDWLRVIGMLLLFCVFMVLLRFMLNCLIDVYVLRDFSRISRIRRKVCPWLHPRTRPQPQNDEPNEMDSQLQLITMERLLAGMSFHEKQELLTSMLKSEIVTHEDLEGWKQGQEQRKMNISTLSTCSSTLSSPQEDEGCDCSVNCTENEMAAPQDGSTRDILDDSEKDLICPICIHSIEVEQPIISLPCLHRFHCGCLIQWLSTHTRDCPYCRTEILTQGMLEQAYRQRHSRRSVDNV